MKKRKIIKEENCLDCYGNNPFIQNEGLQSYYNMLPKDDCGKCKDTPYPNPGKGNCCEDPDHSGIYTSGCIEGYGTKCDPLRIKEGCLPSGDCECSEELICKGNLPEVCDYTLEGLNISKGDNRVFEVNIDGEWVDKTEEVKDGKWVEESSLHEITEWRIRQINKSKYVIEYDLDTPYFEEGSLYYSASNHLKGLTNINTTTEDGILITVTSYEGPLVEEVSVVLYGDQTFLEILTAIENLFEPTWFAEANLNTSTQTLRVKNKLGREGNIGISIEPSNSSGEITPSPTLFRDHLNLSVSSSNYHQIFLGKSAWTIWSMVSHGYIKITRNSTTSEIVLVDGKWESYLDEGEIESASLYINYFFTPLTDIQEFPWGSVPYTVVEHNEELVEEGTVTGVCESREVTLCNYKVEDVNICRTKEECVLDIEGILLVEQYSLFWDFGLEDLEYINEDPGGGFTLILGTDFEHIIIRPEIGEDGKYLPLTFEELKQKIDNFEGKKIKISYDENGLIEIKNNSNISTDIYIKYIYGDNEGPVLNEKIEETRVVYSNRIVGGEDTVEKYIQYDEVIPGVYKLWFNTLLGSIHADPLEEDFYVKESIYSLPEIKTSELEDSYFKYKGSNPNPSWAIGEKGGDGKNLEYFPFETTCKTITYNNDKEQEGECQYVVKNIPETIKDTFYIALDLDEVSASGMISSNINQKVDLFITINDSPLFSGLVTYTYKYTSISPGILTLDELKVLFNDFENSSAPNGMKERLITYFEGNVLVIKQNPNYSIRHGISIWIEEVNNSDIAEMPSIILPLRGTHIWGDILYNEISARKWNFFVKYKYSDDPQNLPIYKTDEVEEGVWVWDGEKEILEVGVGEGHKIYYPLQIEENCDYYNCSGNFEVLINGEWKDVTDEVYFKNWYRFNSVDTITEYRIIDNDEVVEQGEVDKECNVSEAIYKYTVNSGLCEGFEPTHYWYVEPGELNSDYPYITIDFSSIAETGFISSGEIYLGILTALGDFSESFTEVVTLDDIKAFVNGIPTNEYFEIYFEGDTLHFKIIEESLKDTYVLFYLDAELEDLQPSLQDIPYGGNTPFYETGAIISSYEYLRVNGNTIPSSSIIDGVYKSQGKITTSYVNSSYGGNTELEIYEEHITECTERFFVEINGVWEDRTYEIENGIWSPPYTSDVATSWRIMDGEEIVEESTEFTVEVSEPPVIEEGDFSICEKLTEHSSKIKEIKTTLNSHETSINNQEIILDNHEDRITILEENDSGEPSGETYLFENGLNNDEGNVKLGGELTEDTIIDNPGDKKFKIGKQGDSINLNLEIPSEFQSFANTFSGFDYQSDKFKAVVGLIKGITFPDMDINNADIVGRFMIEGNPFDPTSGSEGSIFMDGVWHDEEEDAVAANRVSVSFEEGQVVGMNIFRQYKNEQVFVMQGNNTEQLIYSNGEEVEQNVTLEGNNSEQTIAYIGNEGTQVTLLVGNDGLQESSVVGNNNTQFYNLAGSNNKRSFNIEGDSNVQETLIVGTNNLMSRSVINNSNNKTFEENIGDSYHITTLSGDYDYSAESFFFRGSNGIRQIIGTTQAVTAGAGFTVRQGANTIKHQLATNGDFYFGRDGAYRAINYEASGNKMGFFGADAVAQQIVPLGSTSDDIIQALQNLGLFRES